MREILEPSALISFKYIMQFYKRFNIKYLFEREKTY